VPEAWRSLDAALFDSGWRTGSAANRLMHDGEGGHVAMDAAGEREERHRQRDVHAAFLEVSNGPQIL
jgi:hypothetical protein